MSIIDFKAAQKWNKIPKNVQELLLNNVFCSTCGVTTIIDYSLHNEKLGVLLKGKCKKCGYNVARLVEDEKVMVPGKPLINAYKKRGSSWV